MCKKCGTNYHVKSAPPKKAGFCDKCGGELIIRDDDRPEAVQKRLEVYRTQTEPLIDFYRRKGLIVDIDAAVDVDSTVFNFKKALGYAHGV
jgi:adenylate kinase